MYIALALPLHVWVYKFEVVSPEHACQNQVDLHICEAVLVVGGRRMLQQKDAKDNDTSDLNMHEEGKDGKC